MAESLLKKSECEYGDMHWSGLEMNVLGFNVQNTTYNNIDQLCAAKTFL